MKKGKVKRKLLIREGYRLMREKGFQGTSIDELVGNLGIPKGSFYYYFKNKEDFAIEVLGYYIEIVLRKIEKTLSDVRISPKQRVIKLYSDYIDTYTNKGGTMYGNFASRLLKELSVKNDTVTNKVLEFFEHIRLMHVNCLQQARRAGEIDRSTDIEKVTKLIIYSWEGALLRMDTTGNIRSLFAFRELVRDYLLK